MELTPVHWNVRVVAVPDDGVMGPFPGVPDCCPPLTVQLPAWAQVGEFDPEAR